MQDRSEAKKLRAELRKRYLKLLEPKTTDQQDSVIRLEIEVLEGELKVVDSVTQVEIEKKRSSKKIPVKKYCLMCRNEINTTRKYCSSLCRIEGLRKHRMKKTTRGNVRSGQAKS